jgi:general secretion pathway protein I
MRWGYTLIEVLVAMTILAMSLVVLFRIFSTGLVNVGISADYARAVIVAETRLAAAGLDTGLRQGRTEGAVDERFYWFRTVEDYVPAGQPGNQELPIAAFLVTVAVEWEHRGHTRQVILNTIQLMPETDGAT